MAIESGERAVISSCRAVKAPVSERCKKKHFHFAVRVAVPGSERDLHEISFDAHHPMPRSIPADEGRKSDIAYLSIDSVPIEIRYFVTLKKSLCCLLKSQFMIVRQKLTQLLQHHGRQKPEHLFVGEGTDGRNSHLCQDIESGMCWHNSSRYVEVDCL